MRVIAAVGEGMRRASRLPGLVGGLWLIQLAAALPAALLVSGSIYRSVAYSLAAEELAAGFDFGWFGEFEHQAEGLAATFRPSLIGVGAFLDNLESLLRGDLFVESLGLAGLGVLFALGWTFLLGGILSRLRSPASGTSDHLVATGQRYFRRFLALTLISAPLYYGVYRTARWLFPRLETLTRDVTTETTVLGVYLGAMALMVGFLGLIRLTGDYARAAIVVEDRRSALGAWVRGARFVVGHPIRTTGILVGFGLLGALALLVYSWVAPGAGPSTWASVVGALLLGQLLLCFRLWVRLAAYGAELALYDSAVGS